MLRIILRLLLAAALLMISVGLIWYLWNGPDKDFALTLMACT